ncbi:MAG: bacteriophage CI repressor [Deltaproteobacteria bacterium]|nr:bacteriophage CI repressor [Deltaproteobacteria bacterium]
MNDVRTTLNEIKKILGIMTDADLAEQIGIPLHTLRSWIQNNSIRKQLITYCADHGISLDEVLLSKKRFHRDQCKQCRQKETCTEYRKTLDQPLTIGEGRLEPRMVLFNTHYSETAQIELHGEGRVKSSLMLDLGDIDKIAVKLQAPVMNAD